jgi:hypothetical protein
LIFLCLLVGILIVIVSNMMGIIISSCAWLYDIDEVRFTSMRQSQEEQLEEVKVVELEEHLGIKAGLSQKWVKTVQIDIWREEESVPSKGSQMDAQHQHGQHYSD